MTHDALLVEPRFGLDEPISHARHAADDAPPGASFHEPAGQGVHDAAEAPEKAPGGHAVQLCGSTLPARLLNVPAGQAEHAARPGALLYVPGMHE